MAKGWLPGNNSYENMDIKNDPEQIKKTKLWWNTYVKAMYIMGKALVDNGVVIITGRLLRILFPFFNCQLPSVLCQLVR